MNFISQQYPDDQDQHLSDPHPIAKLSVSCDSDGRVSFDYDWEDSEEAATGMASILSVLDIDKLSHSMLQDMKEKSKTKEDLDMVKGIEVLFVAITSLKNQSVENTTEEIVVDPIEVISLL